MLPKCFESVLKVFPNCPVNFYVFRSTWKYDQSHIPTREIVLLYKGTLTHLSKNWGAFRVFLHPQVTLTHSIVFMTFFVRGFLICTTMTEISVPLYSPTKHKQANHGQHWPWLLPLPMVVCHLFWCNAFTSHIMGKVRNAQFIFFYEGGWDVSSFLFCFKAKHLIILDIFLFLSSLTAIGTHEHQLFVIAT